MTHRIVWPLTALVGLVLVVLWISSTSAQPRPGMQGWAGPPQPGRFAVAYGSADKVIILDTATGKLYKATGDDFQKMSELPKFGMMMPMPFPGRPEVKDTGIVPSTRRPAAKDKAKEKTTEKKEESRSR